MTSNSSSMKPFNLTRNLMLHTLRSHWWLAVICSVVYGFAGPVFNLLQLSSITRRIQRAAQGMQAENTIRPEYMMELAEWFSDESFMMLYGSAVVLAAIIGCVMFFYLHKKQQVNFYHSQPVSRTRLFAIRYITGLIVTLVPLFIMTGVMLLLVAGYGYGAVLDATAVGKHLCNMILFALASYSLAVFSAQLTGMAATHAVLNAILHFAAPVTVLMISGLCELFYATYSGGLDVTPWLRFSPFCAVVHCLDRYAGYQIHTGVGLSTMKMHAVPVDGLTVAVQCAIILLGSAAALWLYGKRPSEATDKAMVYPVTEPVLKAFLMFLISIAAGLVFTLASNRAFFYFAVVAFAILTHMTCEVILRHDFRAMGNNLRQCAVILLLILATVGCLRLDVFHYDTWMPEQNEIAQVGLVVSQAEPGQSLTSRDIATGDADVIAAAYELLQPVVKEHRFAGNSFAADDAGMPTDNSTTIVVTYTLKNGRTVTRTYSSVPVDGLQDSYRTLYNLQAYREALYRDILQMTPDDLMAMYRTNGEEIYMANRFGETYYEQAADSAAVPEGSRSGESGKELAMQILNAYRQDLKNRNFDVLTGPQREEFSMDMICGDNQTRYKALMVYDADVHTMAVLNTLPAAVNNNHWGFNEAMIVRCDGADEQQITQLADEMAHSVRESGDVAAPMDKQVLQIIRIEGNEAVDRLIYDTGIMQGKSIFAKTDTQHLLLMHTKEKGEDHWSGWTLVQDALPEQYR